ncbi:MAG TPA: energy transducer TonB [Vicinamibacterales bacterium]|nr:energy transducer TonB [Vicinamibacterales bacterium]
MKTLAILALIGAASVAAAQDDPLRTARDLYASAAYAEAMTELARVASAMSTPATTRDADAYRTFCLIALGRDSEAQTLAESLVRRDPTFSIDKFPDASPRIVTMFESVRRRVLPQIVRDEYRVARARATEHAPDAAARLRSVQQLLNTSERIGAWDQTLADIRLIVDGFLELARADEPRPAAGNAPAKAAAPAAPSTVVAASSSTNAGVVAPIAVFQPQPNIPDTLRTLVRQLHRTSTIDVVINERGTVDDVMVKEPVTSAYDKLIVATARTWRYKPALKDGIPVKFVTTVVINVGSE